MRTASHLAHDHIHGHGPGHDLSPPRRRPRSPHWQGSYRTWLALSLLTLILTTGCATNRFDQPRIGDILALTDQTTAQFE